MKIAVSPPANHSVLLFWGISFVLVNDWPNYKMASPIEPLAACLWRYSPSVQSDGLAGRCGALWPDWGGCHCFGTLLGMAMGFSKIRARCAISASGRFNRDPEGHAGYLSLPLIFIRPA